MLRQPFWHKLVHARIRSKLFYSYPVDFSPDEIALYERVAPYTLTGVERVVTLRRAIEYVIHNDIHGAFVECGVWRGGNLIAMAEGVHGRPVFGYDTFSGMPPATEEDVSQWGEHADSMAPRMLVNGQWSGASIDEVRAALNGLAGRVTLVVGRVEDTIPAQAPDTIALLRLDTDFYESTRHELTHLYPRLASGGVLIIDDYEYWRGARKAVDEYFAGLKPRPFLGRIDSTARIAIKP
jgi:hypothetical protein